MYDVKRYKYRVVNEREHRDDLISSGLLLNCLLLFLQFIYFYFAIRR